MKIFSKLLPSLLVLLTISCQNKTSQKTPLRDGITNSDVTETHQSAALTQNQNAELKKHQEHEASVKGTHKSEIAKRRAAEKKNRLREYCSEAVKYNTYIALGIMKSGQFLREAGQDLSLISDVNWRKKMAASLDLIMIGNSKVLAMNSVPDEMQKTHHTLIQLSDEAKNYAIDIAKGLDDLDTQRFQSAGERINRVMELADEAGQQLDQAKVRYKL